MFSRLLPNQYVKSIYDIDLFSLKDRGIRAVITDLDNTLVEWHRAEATPEVKEWFAKLEETGLNVTIVSNNSEKRVKEFCDPEEKVFIHSAKKNHGVKHLKGLVNKWVSEQMKPSLSVIKSSPMFLGESSWLVHDFGCACNKNG